MNSAAQNQDPQSIPQRHLPAQALKMLAVTSIAAIGVSELPASSAIPVGTEAAIAGGPGRPHGITIGKGNQHPDHGHKHDDKNGHKHGGRAHGITIIGFDGRES